MAWAQSLYLCLKPNVRLSLRELNTLYFLSCWSAQGEDKENEETKEEEPPKEMTLDEWKQMQEKERVKATFELRKPGEGEKKGMWKNTKVLKKTEDEDDEQFAARRVS